jgi:hypothetical protein
VGDAHKADAEELEPSALKATNGLISVGCGADAASAPVELVHKANAETTPANFLEPRPICIVRLLYANSPPLSL